MNRSIIAAIAVATSLLTACGGSSEKPSEAKTVRAHVLIELRYPYIADALDTIDDAPDQCAGGLDYESIRTGSPVTIRDEDAEIVGTTELEQALPADNLVICTWSTILDVESNSEFFTAEVGGWVSTAQRVEAGDVRFSLDTVKEDPEFGSTAELDPAWSAGAGD